MIRTLLARAAVVAVAFTSTAAFASAVVTPNGDPFPAGSSVVLTGATVTIPTVGTADTFTISDFDLTSISLSGGNEYFDYTADFSTTFSNGATLDATGGTFDVEVKNRSSLFRTGTFDAVLTEASFSGLVGGILPVSTSLSSNATGTAVDSFDNSGDLQVATTFTVPAQYSVNGGPNTSAGNLNGTSTTPSVPEPATIALLGAGLVGLVGARRRA